MAENDLLQDCVLAKVIWCQGHGIGHQEQYVLHEKRMRYKGKVMRHKMKGMRYILKGARHSVVE